MSKTKDKTNRMVSVIGVFAILLSANAIVYSTVLQQRSAYGIDKNMTNEETTSRATEMKQHLSKTNVPVTLPLIKGYVKGN